MIAANPPPLDREGASGLALGFFQGLTPGAALLDANQRSLGTSPRSSPSFERFKYFGQAIGGLALTAFGMGGSVGGIGLNATGIGALVGVPALAVSSTVITAGVANTLAGWQGLWQSLATGGSAGPAGVSAGPAAPVKPQGQVHHAISKKVWKALEDHPLLKGNYKYRDERFATRGANLDAHKGYQQWHVDLDKEIVKWIEDHPGATPEVFENYLLNRYAAPDLNWRFPNGL